MNRWTTYLLQALAALAESADAYGVYPYAVAARHDDPSPSETTDAFRAIVHAEWGPDAFA